MDYLSNQMYINFVQEQQRCILLYSSCVLPLKTSEFLNVNLPITYSSSKFHYELQISFAKGKFIKRFGFLLMIFQFSKNFFFHLKKILIYKYCRRMLLVLFFSGDQVLWVIKCLNSTHNFNMLVCRKCFNMF